MIKPLGSRVIIKQDEAVTQVGSILLAGDQEKPAEGTVIAVGPGTDKYTMNVTTGDRVLFGKYSGTEIEFEGDALKILNEPEILATL